MGFKNKTPGCYVLFITDPLESKDSLYSAISWFCNFFSWFNTCSLSKNLPPFAWVHFPCLIEKKCPINIYWIFMIKTWNIVYFSIIIIESQFLHSPQAKTVFFIILKSCEQNQNTQIHNRNSTWPAKTEIFTIWPSTENVCWLLVWIQRIFPGLKARHRELRQ